MKKNTLSPLTEQTKEKSLAETKTALIKDAPLTPAPAAAAQTAPATTNKTSSAHAPATKKATAVKWILLGGIFLLSLGIGYVYQRVSGTAGQIFQSNSNTSILEQIKNVTEKKAIKGEKNDRINILLLGMGGLDHPGGTLTDTIMVASIKPSTKEVSLLSLPRDLIVKYYDDNNPKYYEGHKINQAYEVGGIDLVIEKIKDVTGLTMQYYVWIDFDGFRQIIDDIGGLDVYVENGFTDSTYPDYNYGYQTVSFSKGWTKMNGEKALQYARSRHGNHNESGDFARAARQQIIMEAAKTKLFSASTLLNPIKINNLLTDLGDHFKTNAEPWELLRLADLVKDVAKADIINKVVDDSTDGLVHTEFIPETGASVVLPNAGDYNYSEIKELAENIFNEAPVTKEESSVEIQNGTSKAGLGAQTAEKIRLLDITVLQVGNATENTWENTTIFDLTSGQKPNTLQILTANFPNATWGTLENGKNLAQATADFLIILGADQVTNPLAIETDAKN